VDPIKFNLIVSNSTDEKSPNTKKTYHAEPKIAQHETAHVLGVYVPGNSTARPSQCPPYTSVGLSRTASSCAGIRAEASSCADSPGFSCQIGVSCSDSWPYLVNAMSVSLAERFAPCLFRKQQNISVQTAMIETTAAPTAIPAIAPVWRTVDLGVADAVDGEISAVLVSLEMVAFVVVMLGGGVLILGVSVHSPPILMRRVSVVALACQSVHVSASRSTMMYAAEKNGLPTIDTSLTLSLDVGAIRIPGLEGFVLKAPSDVTYSWGKMRRSLDRVNVEVPSRTTERSPPYLGPLAFDLGGSLRKKSTYWLLSL
jgi:hypothetical protein